MRDLHARDHDADTEPTRSIGVKVDGEYRQLNANMLQIENEYYSFIRPKRVARYRRAAHQGAAPRRRAVRRNACRST